MSNIDSISSSFGSANQILLAKTERGWDAFQRLQKNNASATRSGEELKFTALDPKRSLQTQPTQKPLEFSPLLAEGMAKFNKSNMDIFTGTEMNASVAKDESQAGKADRARQAAEKLVASTLVEPILKQARETNNTAPPFGPTSAEKQFGSVLDASLANQMVSAANFPLVKQIQQNLLQHSAYMNKTTEAHSADDAMMKQMHNQTLDLVG